MVVAPMPIFIVSKQLSSIICMLLFHLPITAFVRSNPVNKADILENLKVFLYCRVG